MKEMFARLWKEESGQGLAEYGLILALVAIAAIVGLNALSGGINTRLQNVADEIN